MAALDDGVIAARMMALHVAWGDAEQTILNGTAATDVDGVQQLLNEMGADAATLNVPDRVYVFERSPYGTRALNATSKPPEGEEEGEEAGFGEVDDAAVPTPA